MRKISVLALVILGFVAVMWLTKERSRERSGPISSDAEMPSPAPAPQPATRRRSPSGAPPSSPSPERPSSIPLRRAEIVRGGQMGFSGTVVDWGTGKPVAEAEIAFEGALGLETTTTETDGRFRFTPTDGGDYRLALVSKEGYLPYAPALGTSPIVVSPVAKTEVAGLTVYLIPAVSYRGLVVDSDGGPVAGAVVSVSSMATGERELLPMTRQYTSGDAGELEIIAADWSVLEAVAPDGRVGSARIDDKVQTTRQVRIIVGRPPAQEIIAGIVVDDSGEPIAGAKVRLYAEQDPRMSDTAVTAPAQVETDEDGSFAAVVDEGRLFVALASAEGFAEGRKTAMPGKRDLRIALQRSASIRGAVVDRSGAAVASFQVVVFAKGEGIARRIVKTATFFSAEGAFLVGGLEEGEYEVEALAYGLARSHPVTAVARQEPREIDVVLGTGATLTGVVIDVETREPIENAKVQAESMLGGGSSALPLTATAITASDGSFELPGLGPGRVSVVASAFRHNRKIVSALDAREGATLGPLTVELTPVADGDEPVLELAGIGAAISANQRGCVIERVLPGGGAELAELKPGDVIIAIDGAAVVELGFEASLQRLRGPVDTRVSVDIERDQRAFVRKVVTRRKIRF